MAVLCPMVTERLGMALRERELIGHVLRTGGEGAVSTVSKGAGSAILSRPGVLGAPLGNNGQDIAWPSGKAEDRGCCRWVLK